MKGITCTHTETKILAGGEQRLIDTLAGSTVEVEDIDATAEVYVPDSITHLFVRMGKQPIVSKEVYDAIFSTIKRHATVKLYLITPSSVDGHSVITIWNLTRSLDRDVRISYVRMFDDTLVVQFGFITRD